MDKVVLGIVDTPKQAEAAVQRLEAMGFPDREISVLFPDRRGNHDFAFEQHTKAPQGALAGAVIGAVLGAALGLALEVGMFEIPGLEALAAAGPVIAALAVAMLGSLVLMAVGAVVGATIPEILAKHYAGKVDRGSILVGVHVGHREEISRAREVLRSVAASDVRATAEAATPARGRA